MPGFSREDQQLSLQLDALPAAGVPHADIIKEKESGIRQRPGFDALLKRLQPGDSLVAWKVDRLGREPDPKWPLVTEVLAQGQSGAMTCML